MKKERKYITHTITNPTLIKIYEFLFAKRLALQDNVAYKIHLFGWVSEIGEKSIAEMRGVSFAYHMIGFVSIDPVYVDGILNVNVIVRHPGILIGREGRTINELERYLGKHFGETKILIKESREF